MIRVPHPHGLCATDAQLVKLANRAIEAALWHLRSMTVATEVKCTNRGEGRPQTPEMVGALAQVAADELSGILADLTPVVGEVDCGVVGSDAYRTLEVSLGNL
jgi:hypothetical protein